MKTEKINLTSSKKTKWSHVPYKIEDLPAIGLFFKLLYKGGGDYGNMALFHWKIINNYVQKGIINLIKDKNRIASTTSVTPKILVLKNKKINAAEIGDTYTHPDYWRQGMFSLLINQTRRDALREGIDFIYGTPNKLSLPGYQKKANFDIINNLKVRTLIFPVDISQVMTEKIHWIFGSIIHPIFKITFSFFSKLNNIFLPNDKSITLEEIYEIPDDWNKFWNQAKEGYDFIFNRNVEAIKWRYFDNPNQYNFITLRKNKSLIGYIVCRVTHNENTKNIVIADYLTIPGEEVVLITGINKIINDAFAIGANLVSLWCVEDTPHFKIFKKKGFIVRNSIPIICYQNEFSEQMKSRLSWHFTVGDSDNI